MKKYLVAIGVGSLLTLSACGEGGNGDDAETASESDEEVTADEETNGGNDDSDDGNGEDDGEDDAADENDEAPELGETETTEGGDFTAVSQAIDVGTYESGPIELEIEGVVGVSAELEGEAAELLETNELEYIQVEKTVENTSEDHVTFYASQGTMVTDTGEQLEEDPVMSEHIDGEYLGEVTKEGSSLFILENSSADGVESIELYFDAAHDDEWEDIGEDIEVEIDLEQ